MLLSNLMDTWGEDEGVRPNKILDALELNRRQTHGGARFSIDRLQNDWEITVHPKHGYGRESFHMRRARPRDVDENLSTKEKMNMGLDDIIAGEGGARGSSSRDHFRPTSDCQPNAISFNGKVEVIDLEDENFNPDDLAPHPQSFASTGWARRRREDQLLDYRDERRYSSRLDHDLPYKVKVSKYVSYVLKKGHYELGIDLWHDYADLNDLVRLLNQKRAFGDFTLEHLKNTLQDSDDVGRFQFWNNWVRKVDKADRDPHQYMARPVGMASPVGMDIDGPQGAPRAPPRPPGEYWTQYTDEGQDKVWWYYEGPLGKWWCDDDAETVPRVWTFDG
jgi:hypothetical protein